MVHQQTIAVSTRGHGDMHDLTGEVSRIVAASGIQTGIAHIFNVGSTGAIGVIEFEPGLEQDLPELLDRLIPPSRHTAMNRPGMTATAIRIYRPPCWGLPRRCQSARVGSFLELGSRSFTLNAISNRGKERWW